MKPLLVVLPFLLLISCSSNPPLLYTDLQNRARVSVLQSHLEVNNVDSAARYELISIFLEELFFPEAERELEELIRVNRNEIDAYNLLALVLVQGPKSDYTQAAVILKVATMLAPDRIDTRLALALTYAELGKVSEARVECDAILSKSRESREMATAYLIKSSLDPDHQAEYLRRATDLDPSMADSERPITIPVYVNRRSFQEFGTHPQWSVRLRDLNAALENPPR